MAVRQHPCWQWCGERLLGIIENQKLLNEIDHDGKWDVRSITRVTILRPGTAVLKCQHGRSYTIREVDS